MCLTYKTHPGVTYTPGSAHSTFFQSKTSKSSISQTKHKVEREPQKVDQMCKRRLLNESLKCDLSSKSSKKLKISTPNFMSHKKKLD